MLDQYTPWPQHCYIALDLTCLQSHTLTRGATAPLLERCRACQHMTLSEGPSTHLTLEEKEEEEEEDGALDIYTQCATIPVQQS